MAYFSNGTEGMILDDQCAECPVGESEDSCCPVHAIQMLYNYDQLKKGNEQLKEAMNVLVDDKGKCQMRVAILKATVERDDPDPTPIDPKSLPSFLKMDGV